MKLNLKFIKREGKSFLFEISIRDEGCKKDHWGLLNDVKNDRIESRDIESEERKSLG